MTAIPKSIAARKPTTQQTVYWRFGINFNDAFIAAPRDPVACIPALAFITQVLVEIVTAFNAVTTNVLTIGTTTGNANEIVNAADVDETTLGVTPVTRARGTTLTAAGDINVYVKYTQTGTAATAGKARVVIEYVPIDQDG